MLGVPIILLMSVDDALKRLNKFGWVILYTVFLSGTLSIVLAPLLADGSVWICNKLFMKER